MNLDGQPYVPHISPIRLLLWRNYPFSRCPNALLCKVDLRSRGRRPCYRLDFANLSTAFRSKNPESFNINPNLNGLTYKIFAMVNPKMLTQMAEQLSCIVFEFIFDAVNKNVKFLGFPLSPCIHMVWDRGSGMAWLEMAGSFSKTNSQCFLLSVIGMDGRKKK